MSDPKEPAVVTSSAAPRVSPVPFRLAAPSPAPTSGSQGSAPAGTVTPEGGSGSSKPGGAAMPSGAEAKSPLVQVWEPRRGVFQLREPQRGVFFCSFLLYPVRPRAAVAVSALLPDACVALGDVLQVTRGDGELSLHVSQEAMDAAEDGDVCVSVPRSMLRGAAECTWGHREASEWGLSPIDAAGGRTPAW